MTSLGRDVMSSPMNLAGYGGVGGGHSRRGCRARDQNLVYGRESSLSFEMGDVRSLALYFVRHYMKGKKNLKKLGNN